MIGLLIVGAGFFAGRAIGGAGDDGSLGNAVPSGISTRQSALQVPTLEEVKRVPSLETTQSSAEVADEETPSESVEQSAAEVEAAPESSSSPPPEVTVAPNG